MPPIVCMGRECHPMYSTGGLSHFKIYYTWPTPIYPLSQHLSTPLANTYIYVDSANVRCTVICVISTSSVLPTSTLKLTEGSAAVYLRLVPLRMFSYTSGHRI
ncbi:hypothetical protein PAXRUDRAFT_21876 [Paxillus rubicundulus Ve08.2h10]|uniref:Unplaced genomic scaffold scaffold_5900, whole genome shotgun sequence n=1 Tax=Paxillus rubicundulus Ve08.2h10 TaxID=930991 RepID=A0A0D0D6L6_9AGAM|nr:hypothetical protein PAXRUDRAFT_21876 [Paxillus rubicundulus Ve08.2h10]